MRKYIASAAAAATTLAVVAPLTLAPSASAEPGSPGCVTRSEFRKVDTRGSDAWTRKAVTKEFRTKGRVTSSGSAGISVEYRTCAGNPDWSYAEVDFDNQRAWFKWIYISR